MKAERPDLHLSINGGIATLDAAQEHLDAGMDGVMIGRAAYHQPADILMRADSRIFGGTDPMVDPREVARAMQPHIERHLAARGKLSQVTRHMLGLFAGRPGARHWKRVLSENAHRPDADARLLEEAMGELV